MFRIRTWALAMTSAVLMMINFGNCCCLIGLPIGIWALVILLLPDVQDAFKRSVAGQPY
jgi:ABC-type proline/glycine betaine transport system permease subunit